VVRLVEEQELFLLLLEEEEEKGDTTGQVRFSLKARSCKEKGIRRPRSP
jgi:hypothetical protein